MVATDRVHKLIAQHTTDLVCVHDAENTIRFATDSSKQILGYDSHEIIGKKLTDFLSPEFVSELDFTTLKRFFENPGSRLRYQIKHKENRLRWLESTFVHIDQEGDKWSLLSSTRDITESVHLTDDLMTALASEQKFSQFKANLYMVTSHEFKTPLAVIMANIEMLRIKKSEKVLEKALISMEEEVDRLNSMIEDMLELRKLTTGKTSLRLEEVDLGAMLTEVIEKDLTKPYPNIEKHFSIEGTAVEVMADYSLMRYVFSNLLTNACKYSNNKTEVIVKMNYREKDLQISVQDYGIGIPEEDKPSIFTSFFRAGNVSNIHGTGVGLSIVKEFVDLHKGKIYFESTAGEGTTFFVELPYSRST